MDAISAKLSVAHMLRSPALREFIKYGFASAIALAVDIGLLTGLAEIFGVYPLVASAISFMSGCLVLYVISILAIFPQRRVSDRRAEFLLFLLIGLCGLGITEVVLFTGELLGWGYLLAKLPAIALTFLFNFAARKFILFHNSSAGAISS